MGTKKESPTFKSWRSYSIFAHQVMREQRYILPGEEQEFLDILLKIGKDRKTKIKKGTKLWRAQLGHDWEPYYQDGEYIDDIECPLEPARMKPIPDKAKESRANPKGIPYLYLSNKKNTALSEVRPWLGALTTLALLEIKRDLVVVACLEEDPKRHFYIDEPDPEEREKAVWSGIDRAFSKPVTPNDSVAEYAPTQIIAELFKMNGFDGIIYRSALDAGYNIVLFSLDDADVISCQLFKVDNLEFSFQPNSNPYYVTKKGEKSDS